MATEKIVMMPPSEIIVPQGWNARFGDLTKEQKVDPETGEVVTWEVFEASCKGGINTALVGRPVKGGKIELVSGFRRHLAATRLGLKEIPIIIRELTEVKARLENVRENTARKDLKAADLAWSLHELVKAEPSYDLDGGITLMANDIGMSQPYVGKLRKIMKDVKSSITKQWRENTTVPVSTKEMYSLCLIDKSKQDEEWQNILKGKGDKGARGPNAWKDGVRKKCNEFGKQLGALKRLGLIEGVDGEWIDVVDACIKYPPQKAKLPDRQSFAKHLEKGFEEGQVEPEEQGEEEQEGDE